MDNGLQVQSENENRNIWLIELSFNGKKNTDHWERRDTDEKLRIIEYGDNIEQFTQIFFWMN